MSDHDLLSLGIPVADKLLRTVVVYFGTALALRLAGKRDLAQLNSFDLGGDAAAGERGAERRHRARQQPDRRPHRHHHTPQPQRRHRALGGTARLGRPLVRGHQHSAGEGRPLYRVGVASGGLRKADIEVVLRQQNANGPQEVAEAMLTRAAQSSSGSSPRRWAPGVPTSMRCAAGSTSLSSACATGSTGCWAAPSTAALSGTDRCTGSDLAPAPALCTSPAVTPAGAGGTVRGTRRQHTKESPT